MRPYKEIQFYRTPIEQRLLVQKIRVSPSLYYVFKKRKDVTGEVRFEISKRTKGSINNFITLFITGEQGKMKSTFAISIATEYDETGYNVDRIKFNYDEFKRGIDKSNPKEWYQLDEEVFKHGTGSRRLLNEIQTLIETLRKRQNSMIIVSPELKYFDEKLFTFVLEMLDNRVIVTCPHNQKPHEMRTCECDMKNNYKVLHAEARALVKRQGQYIGYCIFPIEWDTELWKEYNVKKDDFMEKTKSGHANENEYNRIAEELLAREDASFYLRKKKSMKLFVMTHYPNLTTEENNLIVEAMSILMDKRIMQEHKDRWNNNGEDSDFQDGESKVLPEVQEDDEVQVQGNGRSQQLHEMQGMESPVEAPEQEEKTSEGSTSEEEVQRED
jgi:hypothetical protein